MTMKNSSRRNFLLLMLLMMMMFLVTGSLRLSPQYHDIQEEINKSGTPRPILKPKMQGAAGGKEEVGMEMYVTGSSLPDCSHACGPCFPCRRVMVSFKCLSTESCPIVYRCMCKGKYYHVPSR